MWRFGRRLPACTALLFVVYVMFFLASPLLMPHSPILDLDGEESQCTSNSPRKTKEERSGKSSARGVFGDDFVSCPGVVFPEERSSEGWRTFREALERYSKFHREKLMQLRFNSSLAKGIKTLTWACSQSKCSGLGDQLYRIQYFFLLALMSDRLFAVYWDEALERSAKYLIPNEIDWSFFDQSKGMCTDRNTVFSGRHCSQNTFSKSSMWGFGWTKDEFAHFSEVLFSDEQHITVTGDVKAYVMFVNRDFYVYPGEKIIAGFKRLGLNDLLGKDDANNTVSCGHDEIWYTILHNLGAHHFMEIPEVSSGKVLASEAWIQVSHVIFCYLFQFPQVLLNEVDRVSRSLGIEDTRYVAVHLRTGFKGMPYEESYATRLIHRNWKVFDDIEVWDSIMAHGFDLADRIIGVGSPVYLCTDTDVAKEHFLRKYGNRLKVADLSLTHSAHSRSKCAGQEIIKIQEPTKSFEIRKISETSIYDDPYVSMWIDFFLLSRSHVMVHGDSSFSVNACFVKPLPHLRQSWVMHDSVRDCVASYMGGKVTCIC